MKRILSVLMVVLVCGITLSQENVLIGLKQPADGVTIKANWPGYTGSWARSFSLSNENASRKFIKFGAYGTVNNGVSEFGYGFIGKKFDQPFMTFKPNGDIGIGTRNPSVKLEVIGDLKVSHTSKTAKLEVEYGKSKSAFNSYDVGGCMYLKDNNGNLRVVFRGYDNPAGSVIDGKLSVGKTTTPNAALDVDGNIKAHEIEVTLAAMQDLKLNGTLAANNITYTANGNTADFVFEDSYQLRELSEVESFIKTNRHLPDIPSAAEMEESGVNLAEMNKLLLQKVEELTLYTIELEKHDKEMMEDRRRMTEELEEEREERKAMRSEMEEEVSSLEFQVEELRKMVLEMAKAPNP